MNKDFGMDIHQLPMIPTPPLPAARPHPIIGMQRGEKFEGPSASDVSKMAGGAKNPKNLRQVTIANHRLTAASQTTPKATAARVEGEKTQSSEVKLDRLGTSSASKEAHKATAEDGLLAIQLLKDLKQTGSLGDREIMGVKFVDIKITRKGNDIDGFTTYEFKVKDEKTGQLQSFKVSDFEKRAYRGPRVEDFVDRLDLAAKALIKYGVAPDDVMKEISKAKADLQKISFNTDEMKSPDTAMDAYKKMDKAANEIIEQWIVDIGTSYKKRTGSFDPKEVAQCERDVIREINKQRPVIINQYKITKGDQTKTFANIQIPQTMKEENGKRVRGETIPTNKRDDVGLVNYCSTSLVEVHESGKATLLFDACRFSSLPPIAVKDSEIRQAMACENAKQFIEDRVADLISSVPEASQGETISVPINYMMLVTAFKGDDLRNKKLGVAGAWKGESEKLQLEETAFALQMFHGREIEVEIEGKVYKVKPDIMFMNLGANVAATTEMKTTVMVDVQQGINARGFIQFQDKAKSFQEDALKDLPNLGGQLDAFKANNARREQFLKTREIPKADFSSKYEALEKKQQALLKDRDNKELRKEVKQMQKELEGLEKRENEKFASQEARQRKEYLEYKDDIQKCEAEMIKNLDDCLNNPEISDEDKEKLLALKNAVRSIHSAANLYYSKSYEKIETVMDTQSAILEALHFMDEFIAFGCKSGKDRTGGQDNLMQSHFIDMAFNNGNIPTTPEERKRSLEYTKAVNQYSASLENSKFNLGLGGLLVSDEAVRGLSGDAKIGKKHANSVKSTYSSVEERMKVSTAEKAVQASQRARRTISSVGVGRKDIKNEFRRKMST